MRAGMWAVLLAVVAVVSTGCAASAPRLGLLAGGWDGVPLSLDGAGTQPACGSEVPAGWPDVDSRQEVLAPFLRCASPAGFVALQRTVDMPRLVESLSDWDAVRLGALGPLDARASEVLGRKRAAFIVSATEKYGVPYAEVFALFVLHSAYDDEVRGLLALLARDKQLEETLGNMAIVREELERRGMGLSRHPERRARAGDVLRGLGRAGRDGLATSRVVAEARYTDFSAKRAQLPPTYRQALDELERALLAERFSPGSVAQGAFDELTFGVPLGFYHLAAGTLQGAGSLAAGEYEQATRELAPAALVVGLYAAGRGASHVREATIAGSEGLRLPSMGTRLKAVVERLEARLGEGAVGELARHVQATREGARLVAEWGKAGAVALHQARGNAAKAQAWLAEAKTERAGPTLSRGSAAKGPGVATQVREAAGYTREALDAKLLRAELEAPGARLPADVGLLKRQQPTLDAPPPGVREGSPLWVEYVEYRARRMAELEQGQTMKGPLRWEGYQEMRGLFTRGLAFERTMVQLLRADAALPRSQRRWLRDFDMPRIETHVGVWKPKTGLRYTDVLVIEERPPVGQPPRVETVSFKSRNLSQMKPDILRAQLREDAREALNYYGHTLNIRRRSLNPEGNPAHVQVQRIRLVYEGGDLKPRDFDIWSEAVNQAQSEVKESRCSSHDVAQPQ